ncbi:hypothetical protein [Streptomyces sp. NPDC002671]
MKVRVLVVNDVADARRVEQVLRNHVVKLAAADGAVTATVPDYGIEVRRGHAHVFSRSWRADPARARPTDGTGLGRPSPRRPSSCTVVGCRRGDKVASVPAQPVGDQILSIAPRLAGATPVADPTALPGAPGPPPEHNYRTRRPARTGH